MIGHRVKSIYSTSARIADDARADDTMHTLTCECGWANMRRNLVALINEHQVHVEARQKAAIQDA